MFPIPDPSSGISHGPQNCAALVLVWLPHGKATLITAATMFLFQEQVFTLEKEEIKQIALQIWSKIFLIIKRSLL